DEQRRGGSAPRMFIDQPGATPCIVGAKAMSVKLRSQKVRQRRWPPLRSHQHEHRINLLAEPGLDVSQAPSGRSNAVRMSMRLLRAIDTVAGIAKAGHDVTNVVQPLVYSCCDDHDIGVSCVNSGDAFGRCD
ncbi:MAG: hypothetical protein ACI88C_003266, partial [Acidimicrobiales bacterium]